MQKLLVIMSVFVFSLATITQSQETTEEKVSRWANNLANDSSWQVRSQSARVLGNMGKDAVKALPDLIQILQDKNDNSSIRVDAVDILSHIGSPAQKAEKILSPLKEILEDNDDDILVRQAAAEAVKKIETTLELELERLVTSLEGDY